MDSASHKRRRSDELENQNSEPDVPGRSAKHPDELDRVVPSLPSSSELPSYRYFLKNTSGYGPSELQQSCEDRWDGLIPEHTDSKVDWNKVDWKLLLKKLGLEPGVFPGFKVKDIMDQKSNVTTVNSKTGVSAPCFDYLCHTLIALSPHGRLTTRRLTGLVREWCPKIFKRKEGKEDNQSLRSVLSDRNRETHRNGILTIVSEDTGKSTGWYALRKTLEGKVEGTVRKVKTPGDPNTQSSTTHIDEMQPDASKNTKKAQPPKQDIRPQKRRKTAKRTKRVKQKSVDNDGTEDSNYEDSNGESLETIRDFTMLPMPIPSDERTQRTAGMSAAEEVQCLLNFPGDVHKNAETFNALVASKLVAFNYREEHGDGKNPQFCGGKYSPSEYMELCRKDLTMLDLDVSEKADAQDRNAFVNPYFPHQIRECLRIFGNLPEKCLQRLQQLMKEYIAILRDEKHVGMVMCRFGHPLFGMDSMESYFYTLRREINRAKNSLGLREVDRGT